MEVAGRIGVCVECDGKVVIMGRKMEFGLLFLFDWWREEKDELGVR